MHSANTSRIVKNTVFLYIRQGITMLIAFYTVGITLDVLGVTDYGISSVVGGAVSMFSFLSGAMAVGNQRFYAFYLGKKDYVRLKEVVGCTLTVYLILIGILLILCETVGLWLVNYKLVIPPERLHAANVIFQIGLISMCLSLMQAPLIGLITAHEDMGIYAKMSILDAVLRLLYLYFLVIIPFDKLIVYSVLGLCVGIITQTIYLIYCLRKYPESHTWPLFNKLVLRELLGFNVWNLCGNFAWMLKNQGTAILLNMFFGPAINAAQNIATNVRSMSSTFAGGFSTAVRPQITKNYASGDHEQMFRLTFGGGKIIYILMAIVVIPAIFNIALVLDLWLPKVPEYAVVFCQLMLVEVLIEQVGSVLATVTQATGKIKNYQLLIGLCGTLNIPISFVALKMGCSPYWVFAISIVCQLGVNAVRVIYLNKVHADGVKMCFRELIVPCSLAAITSGAVCFMFPQKSQLSIAIPIIIIEIGIVASFGYLMALNASEKCLVRAYLKNFSGRLRRRAQNS